MSRPRIFLTRMFLFLAIVVAIAVLLFSAVSRAFLANPALNGLILGVLALGVVYIFRQVLMLYPELRWIEGFRRKQPSLSAPASPRLLAPMATMIGDKGERLSLSFSSMRSLLDGIGARLDESRDISRYLIGLLIFLGLLGTFWGLLETINAVGEVIKGLSVSDGENLGHMFDQLTTGLEAPLAGMGTAFSSSLFGLAGSLVLGFLDLQANQAQNRFFNELEEWLSGLTRLGAAANLPEGGQAVPSYVGALLEQTADSLENLQRTMARSEESRTAADANMVELTERLAAIGDQMTAEQAVLERIAEGQADLKPVLERLLQIGEGSVAGMDEASRARLRSIDVHLNRLLEDSVAGRRQLIEETRSEFRLLARTIAAIADSEKA